MAAWGTEDMAAALPDSASQTGDDAVSTVERKNPQEVGWVKKQSYNYDVYNKSSKELADTQAKTTATAGDEPQAKGEVEGESETLAVGGLREGEWASNGAVYQWDEEYGDVGPAFPDLEEQLFGKKNNHVREGVHFDKYYVPSTFMDQY
jgi:ATP-dependent RNA helicase DDX3X